MTELLLTLNFVTSPLHLKKKVQVSIPLPATGWPPFTGKANWLFLLIPTCSFLLNFIIYCFWDLHVLSPKSLLSTCVLSLRKRITRFELSEKFNPFLTCSDGAITWFSSYFMRFKEFQPVQRFRVIGLISLLQTGSTALALSLQTCWKPTCLPLAVRPSFSCVGHHQWFSLPVSPTWTSLAIPRAVHLLTNTDVSWDLFWKYCIFFYRNTWCATAAILCVCFLTPWFITS